MALRTDYKNDELNTAVNTERQFEEVTNPNGTKSYRDVTDYSQVGDNFDADLVNSQNAEINAKAPLDSPAFTGTPTAPTQSQSTADDTIATTSYVKSAFNNFIDPNLRTSGKAADAQATGNRINSVQASVPSVDTTLTINGAAADAKVVGDRISTVEAIESAEISLIRDRIETESGGRTLTQDDMESGYWAYTTKADNSKRLRNKRLMRVKAGTIVQFENPTMSIFIGVFASTSARSYLQNTGWLNSGSGSFTVLHDGYMDIMVESTVDITVNDFDSTIVVYDTIGENVDSINSDADVWNWMTDKGYYNIAVTDIEQGGWDGGIKYDATNRIRTQKLIPVKSGMTVVFTNPTLRVLMLVYPYKGECDPSQSSGWMSVGSTDRVVNITTNGYLAVIFRKEDESDLDIFDYDCTIHVITEVSNSISDLNKEAQYVKDTFNAINENYINDTSLFLFEKGGFDNTTGEKWYAENRLRCGLFYLNNLFLHIEIASGYQVIVYKIEDDVVTAERYTTTKYIYAYKNAKWGFVIRRSDNAVIDVSEAVNVQIKVYKSDRHEIGHGMYEESVNLINNQYVTVDDLTYHYVLNRYASQPIKIPKSGLRIEYNSEYRRSTGILWYRVLCVELTDSGIVLSEINEDLYAESNNLTFGFYSTYIPYVENAYIIVLARERTSGGRTYYLSDFPNMLKVYSGIITDNNGSVFGLHPFRCFVSNGNLRIIWGTHRSIINTSRYYGGAMKLRYANKIYCAPKYTILANVYRYNLDGTQTLVDSIWSREPDNHTGDGSIAGVSMIDLSSYDFDGIVLFAIHNTEMYIADRTADKVKQVGMGVMSQYDEVFNSVYVEYKNGYHVDIKSGINPTVEENIYHYSRYTVPKRFASYYAHRTSQTQRYYFDEQYDCSPAFYAGGYDSNALFIAVTGKSYYTAMQNPNSRCYNFSRTSDAYQAIGYGLTCTDFVSVLLGRIENFGVNDWAQYGIPYAENISDNWNYVTDMDQLRSGDILAEYIDRQGEGTRIWDGHVMMVRNLVYVNGSLEAVNLIEAGYPYTRLTCVYNNYYTRTLADWQTFPRLADYQFLRRFKPEYINDIRDVFDLSTDYTVGTIMCDRGTDSVYCLSVREIDLSVSDDEAENVRIYKDGELVDTVPIGSTVKNGLRVLDIKPSVTEAGYYTLKTDTSEDVQESFYVPETISFTLDDQVIDGKRHGTFWNYSQLKYIRVVYLHTNELGTTSWGKMYRKDEVTPNHDEEDTCTFDVPVEDEYGQPYYKTTVVYQTPYGAYWVDYTGMSSEEYINN